MAPSLGLARSGQESRADMKSRVLAKYRKAGQYHFGTSSLPMHRWTPDGFVIGGDLVSRGFVHPH